MEFQKDFPPVKKIDQKSVTASIMLYMSLFSDQVQKLWEELDKKRVEAAQKVYQGDVNVEMSERSANDQSANTKKNRRYEIIISYLLLNN